MKKKFIILGIIFLMSMFSVSSFSVNENTNKTKTIEELADENLIKTQTAIIKDRHGNILKRENIISENEESVRNFSFKKDKITSREIEESLASGESILYVDEYKNIQNFKNALIKNYPEKDNEEIAKDILYAIDCSDDIIRNTTSEKTETILDYKEAMRIASYYTLEQTCEKDSNKSEILSLRASNSIGQDDYYEKLKFYTFVAVLGKKSDGKTYFDTYTAVKWLDDPNYEFTDTISIGASSNAMICNYYNSSANGRTGYIDSVQTCKNFKIDAIMGGEQKVYNTTSFNLSRYVSKIYNSLLEGTLITTDDFNTTRLVTDGNECMTTFSAKFLGGPVSCGTELNSSDYYIYHLPQSATDYKYYVSQYVFSDDDFVTGGYYVHEIRDLGFKINPSLSFNGTKLTFSVGGGFTLEKDYQEFHTPCIQVVFDNSNNFLRFEPVTYYT